eukprot:137317-Prorocentrum_minimum.AAC.1
MYLVNVSSALRDRRTVSVGDLESAVVKGRSNRKQFAPMESGHMDSSGSHQRPKDTFSKRKCEQITLPRASGQRVNSPKPNSKQG